MYKQLIQVWTKIKCFCYLHDYYTLYTDGNIISLYEMDYDFKYKRMIPSNRKICTDNNARKVIIKCRNCKYSRTLQTTPSREVLKKIYDRMY